MIRRRALLIEGLAFRAIHKALQNDRTVLYPSKRARRDRQVVSDKIELRELYLLREIQLFGMRDPDFMAIDSQHFDGFIPFHLPRLHPGFVRDAH